MAIAYYHKFRSIPDYPGYTISRRGDVLSARSHNFLTARSNPNGPEHIRYVRVVQDDRPLRVPVPALLYRAFKGAVPQGFVVDVLPQHTAQAAAGVLSPPWLCLRKPKEPHLLGRTESLDFPDIVLRVIRGEYARGVAPEGIAAMVPDVTAEDVKRILRLT